MSVHRGGVTELKWHGRTILSGIVKPRVDGPVRVGELGLDGDAQADTVRHGGPDKALLIYPREHYEGWQTRLGRPLPPAFGENLSTLGLTENRVLQGAVYQIGSVIAQVTQPRRPCYKLGAYLREPMMPVWSQETSRTGIYLRVLQIGIVCAHDPIVLLEQPRHGITVAEVNRVMNVDRKDTVGIERLLAAGDVLPQRWVSMLHGRLAGVLDSDQDRIQGS